MYSCLLCNAVESYRYAVYELARGYHSVSLTVLVQIPRLYDSCTAHCMTWDSTLYVHGCPEAGAPACQVASESSTSIRIHRAIIVKVGVVGQYNYFDLSDTRRIRPIVHCRRRQDCTSKNSRLGEGASHPYRELSARRILRSEVLFSCVASWTRP